MTTPLTAQTEHSFNITLGTNGSLTLGGGTGYLGRWYYYPTTQTYIMWFDNRPYVAGGSVKLTLGANIAPLSQQLSTYTYDTSYCWTEAKWSAVGDATPPLPDAVQDSTVFSKYVGSSSLFSGTRSTTSGPIGHSDQVKTIRTLNPAWVGVMVSGKNAIIKHSYIIGVVPTPPPPVDPPQNPTGACCNPTTGNCSITTLANCGYQWLGEGTTCDSCQQPSSLKYDYGDAPAVYPVLASNNGARHYVVNGFTLGETITAEADGKPKDGANLDTDDGVEFFSDLVVNSLASIRVTATTSLGKLNAWIDYNGDGDWADSGEQIFKNELLAAGTNDFFITIPASAKPGKTYARFRYSTASNLSYTGTASDGEVEDYMVLLLESDNPNPPDVPTLPYHLPDRQYYPVVSQIPYILDAEEGVLTGFANNSLYQEGPIIADDWMSQNGDPIMGLRWWGVFNNWTEASLPIDIPSSFRIGVWSHNKSLGIPDTLLWEAQISDPAISLAGIIDNEGNWSLSETEANYDTTLPASGTICFEFSKLLSQGKWFYPLNANRTYWISISAVYANTTTHSWSWLTNIRETTGNPAQQIFGAYNGTTAAWPPTVGSRVNKTTLADTFDVTFEIISGKVGGATELYNGWLGDLNGDGMADHKDFEELIRLFIL